MQVDEFADLLVLEQGQEVTADPATARYKAESGSISTDSRANQMHDLIEAMQLWHAFGVLVDAGRVSECFEVLQQSIEQLIKIDLAR